jgi:hypothetical protein
MKLKMKITVVTSLIGFMFLFAFQNCSYNNKGFSSASEAEWRAKGLGATLDDGSGNNGSGYTGKTRKYVERDPGDNCGDASGVRAEIAKDKDENYYLTKWDCQLTPAIAIVPESIVSNPQKPTYLIYQSVQLTLSSNRVQ